MICGELLECWRGKLRTSREKVELRERWNLRGQLKDLGELRGEKLEEVDRFAGSSQEKCQGDTQGIFEGPVGKFFRGHVGDILTCVNRDSCVQYSSFCLCLINYHLLSLTKSINFFKSFLKMTWITWKLMESSVMVS